MVEFALRGARILRRRGTESVDIQEGFKGRFKHHCRTLNPLEFVKAYKFLKHRRSGGESDRWNFRQALIDFFTDLLFIKKKATDGLQGKIHTGFLNAYSSSKLSWEKIVRKAVAGNDKTIIICGHSLGAALASLAAAYLLTDFKGRVRLYTFGSPRVGNKEFVTSLTGVIHERYMDCRDIVTRVPSEWLCYAHHGDLRYIFSDGRIETNPETSAINNDRCKAFFSYFCDYKIRLFPNDNDNVWLRDLADHTPINYVSGVLGLR